MSLGAFGDEGNICEEACRCGGDHYDDGLIEGWERAMERAALFVEGPIGPSGADTQLSARALAMSLRAMKGRAREGNAT